MTSPFIEHRSKVLGRYSAASFLRQAVMAMWNGNGYQVGLSDISNLDAKHFQAFLDMVQSYKKHGENDDAFMDLAEDCREILLAERAAAEREEKLEGWMRRLRSELRAISLPATLPDDCYEWFARKFDDGLQPDEAAAAAKAAGLQNRD